MGNTIGKLSKKSQAARKAVSAGRRALFIVHPCYEMWGLKLDDQMKSNGTLVTLVSTIKTGSEQLANLKGKKKKPCAQTYYYDVCILVPDHRGEAVRRNKIMIKGGRGKFRIKESRGKPCIVWNADATTEDKALVIKGKDIIECCRTPSFCHVLPRLYA